MSMKVALIPPISLLEETDRTNMQMCLPHLLEDETYRYVYEQHAKDPDQWVILDNGIAEGLTYEGRQIINLALRTGVNEIVIPDIMQEAVETMMLAKDFYENVYLKEFGLHYMYVVQGINYEQFAVQAIWANEQNWIDTIGVPRHMIETVGSGDSRWRLVDELRHRGYNKPIHLLGAAPKYPTELKEYKWPKFVRSTDTSSPFNFAYAGENFRKGKSVKRPDGYFQTPMQAFDWDCLEFNIKHILDWTK